MAEQVYFGKVDIDQWSCLKEDNINAKQAILWATLRVYDNDPEIVSLAFQWCAHAPAVHTRKSWSE